MTVKIESAKFRTLLIETVLVPVLMVALVGALLVGLTIYLFNAIYWTQHSTKVIAKLSECRALTLDFETSKRGYLFNADSVFLDTHTLAVGHLVPSLNELRMRVCNDPAQVARVVQLKHSALDLMESGAQQMEGRAKGLPIDESKVLADKTAMDDIRRQFDTIQQSEEKLSTKRFERLHRAKLVFIWMGSLLIIMLITLISLSLRRQFSRLAGYYRAALVNLEHRSNELHEQKEWFRVTLISIGEAVIVTDVGGRVVFMNPEAERMTEWTSVDAIRRPLADVFHIVNEKTGANLDSPVDKVLREGRPSGSELHTVLISREERHRWPIHESAAPVMDAFGKLRGVVLVFHDATGPRQEQKALQDQTLVLEKTVQERTEKLRESVRQLESFCYTVSHDLRSPLRAMQSYAKLVLDEHDSVLSGDGHNYLLKIQRAAERLNVLISELLTHSRSSGKSITKTGNLNQIMQDILEKPVVRENGRPEDPPSA